MTWHTYRKKHTFVIQGKPGKYTWDYRSPQGVILAKGARTYATVTAIKSLLATLKTQAHTFQIMEKMNHAKN